MLGLIPEKTDNPKGFLAGLLNLKPDAKDDTFALLLQSFSLKSKEKVDLPKGLVLNTLAAQASEKPEKADPLLLTAKEGEGKTETKNATGKLTALLTLGKNEEASDEEHLNHDLLKALPTVSRKESVIQLIAEAKNYLKEQITQKSDIKELPKTLGGLIKLADKVGVELNKITLDSLPPSPVKAQFAKALTLPELATHKSATPPQAIPHSTSELVRPVITKNEKEAPATKPLNVLLNPHKQEQNVVVDAAKVIEPLAQKAVTEEIQTAKPQLNAQISALLHEPENTDERATLELTPETEKSTDKAQATPNIKHDQLTQKISDAKQLVQHVAQNIRESIENYKPPFTRIKMQLNPQKFGEMDVTLVQRGSNVHININANPTALTVMMQNSHELKAQLSAHGLGDSSMNFSSEQHQQQDNRREEQARLSYEELQDFEEELTQVATSLEIIVPRYI